MDNTNTDFYLKPTFFMDSESYEVKAFLNHHINGDMDEIEKAITLFNAVRDDIYYSPYNIDFSLNGMKASSVIRKKTGYCVAKAVVLCAVLKACKIPSRLGLADVKNHLTTKRLKKVMGTDTFFYHGYTELYIHNNWIKVTPTFNKELCEKFNVKPLEFDGENDTLFHEYDEQGRKHMQYIKDYGFFDELPFDEIKRKSLKVYSGLISSTDKTLSGDFAKEAELDREG